MKLVSCGSVLHYSLLPIIIFFSQKAATQKSAGRPNIIFILAGDLGYGDIGAYSQQKIETPNLDKLAESGVKFKQFA